MSTEAYIPIAIRTNSHDITKFDTESGGDVSSQVLVALFVTVYGRKSGMVAAMGWGWVRTVFGDIVEVVPSDDDGAGHLGRHDLAGQNTATDGDVAGEGALLVCPEVNHSSPMKTNELYAHQCRCR